MTTDASGLPRGLLTGLGPGSAVAGYQVEDRLGVGGMAVVFRARDVRLGRQVALKVLAPPWPPIRSSEPGSPGNGGPPPPSSTRTSSPSTPPAKPGTSCTSRCAWVRRRPAATELKTLNGNGGYMLAFGRDNRLVSLSAPAGNGDKPDTVSAWNLTSPQAAPAQFGVPDGDNSLSPGGSLTYGGDVSTGAVPNYVQDTASGRKIATVPLSFKEDAPVSDTGVLAFTSQTGVTLWDAHSGTVTGFLPYPASYDPADDATITISADGSLVALTSTTGKTYVWNSRKHEITATLTNPAPSALGDHSEFSPDGSALAIQASSSAGANSTYVWNLADRSVPRTLHDFLALSANGKLAAVAQPLTLCDGCTSRLSAQSRRYARPRTSRPRPSESRGTG